MTLSRLPLVVISGYLGSGKTTLINRLLRDAGGQKIMVLVNDFGAINIDAGLLESADEDTLTLTNGCVCCTMGADLFMALGDALDRRPRPDLLVIEASGIANPRNIAEAAKAEPELRYGGIITLVDAVNFLATEADTMIGSQIRDQITAADLLVLAKSSGSDQLLLDRLSQLGETPVIPAGAAELSDIVLDNPGAAVAIGGQHPEYSNWSHTGADCWSLAALTEKLENPPSGAFRIKGKVLAQGCGGWEIHLVGSTVDIRKADDVSQTALVAIGPKDQFDPKVADRWWGCAARPGNQT